MAKKNLSEKVILMASVDSIEENGYSGFSMRDLALRLGCKPASLYNHVEGLDHIKAMVGIYAANLMKEMIENAVSGKERDAAFFDGAMAYRRFAMERYELYKVFISIPSFHNSQVDKAAFDCFHPLWLLIREYGLNDIDSLHYVRALRSVMHGFIELTANGFMQKGDATRDESYEVIIKQFLQILKERGRET